MAIPIEGFENYMIDESGRVFNIKTGKYRKFSVSKHGYCSVDLYNNTKMKRFLLHRLVANAFLPNPLNLPQVNHKDENPQNNHVSNLEWCTAKYNMNYGNGAKTRHTKIDYTKPIYKENAIKNGKKVSRPVLQFTRDGNFIKRFESAKAASIATKTDHVHLLDCCHNKPKYKTANGFIWKFETEVF